MGRLHDALEESGYRGHDLEQLLVRLLFCLFADDTGIFQPKDIFLQLIDNDTADDGGDVGRTLVELFDILDTPEEARQRGLRAELNAFPYVNGALFAGHLRTPVFDRDMRRMLLDAARHDWSGVSPAIFGSLFQSVMSADQRRRIGAHYTSEANILKVIGPLFLDALSDELDRLVQRRTGRDAALLEFQAKLSRLTFLDPACGCGNFLVVAYRELRRLELRCLQALYADQRIDPVLLSRVTVEQFHGIEIEEFPARIAEVAMWMADHLANNEYNEAFQTNSARIPLRHSAHIRHADALALDWSTVITPERLHYIMGNPPFVGAKFQSPEQRAQVRAIAQLGGSGGTLDFVAAWFIKAGQFAAANRRIAIAFVSTNSIVQGEQVAQLWPILFDRFGLEIAFAHRTFSWGSEARGAAHVHVVVIGLTHRDAEPAEKRQFSYPDIRGEPIETRHAALTAYLFDAKGVANRHLVVREVSRPINGAPDLIIGSKPVDGGYLIFDVAERALLLDNDPTAAAFLRPYIGAREFLNGGIRYILSAQEMPVSSLRDHPLLIDRISRVRRWRKGEIAKKGSKTGKDRASESTRPLADFPTRCHVNVFPESSYLVVPENGSAAREYVPAGWLSPPTVPSSLVRVAVDATVWHFAIVVSRNHMAWVNHIGGRLKSDPRYSIDLVYNTFPWPDATPPSAKRWRRWRRRCSMRGRRIRPPAWPTCTTRTPCPATFAARIRRSTSPSTGSIGRNPSPPTATGWSICSAATKSWSTRSPPRGSPPTAAPPAAARAKTTKQHSPNPPLSGEGDRRSRWRGRSPMLHGPKPTQTLAKRLRRSMTLPEVLLWRELRKRPAGLKFRRQHPAGRYVLDFFCAERRLAVEIDGEAHSRGDVPARDAERDAWLATQGVRTCRVAARDVLADLEDVVRHIVSVGRGEDPSAVFDGPPPLAGED